MTARAQRYLHQSPANCRGAVLAVALLFLVILTMLGTTVMSVSQQELKMAGQFQQQSRIHEQAEACLKIAEADATTLVDTQLNATAASLSISTGHIDIAGGAAPAAVSAPSFWSDSAQTLPCAAGGKYVIEYLGVRDIVATADRYTGKTQSLHAFRITVRGHDAISDAQVVLQTIYLRNKV